MKKSILNLGKRLSKNEKMHITGGLFQSNSGTCAYYNGETGNVTYNVTASEAQNSLTNSSDHWCCSSCNQASWYISAVDQMFEPS